MNNTTIHQGSFTSTGANKIIKVRSGIDWFRVINLTQSAATNNGYGFEYYWQKGMGTTAIMKYHPAGDHTVAVNSQASALNIIDSSNYPLGTEYSVTAGTNATRPVYSTGTTTGLTAGAIVRLRGTDHTNLNGKDFSIDNVVGSTSFRLANTLATAPGVIAGASGYYRIVAPNIEVYRLFHPSHREIANITQASSAVITTLVDHGYVAGQKVRFKVPDDFGMTDIDGLTGTITATSTSTITVDIDSSSFTAFNYPTAAEATAAPISPAIVVPYGESIDSDYANLLDDRVYNQGFTGIVLNAGTNLPAGNANDVIYWQAGNVFSTNN